MATKKQRKAPDTIFLQQNLTELMNHTVSMSEKGWSIQGMPTRMIPGVFFIQASGGRFLDNIVRHILEIEKYVVHCSRNSVISILDNIIVSVIQNKWNIKEGVNEFVKELDTAVEVYKIIFRIEGLSLKDIDELKIGKVIFRKYSEEDASLIACDLVTVTRSDEPSSISFQKGKPAKFKISWGEVNAYVEVKATKESTMEISRAKLNESLNLLRFFSPYITIHTPTEFFVGIKGERKAPEGFCITMKDNKLNSVSTLGGQTLPLSIGRMEFEKMKEIGWSILEPLYNSEIYELNELERRIRVAVNWIGRAMQQEERTMSFLHYAIATESLLSLDDREVTEFFADSITLLLLRIDLSIEKKKEFRKKIKEMYGIRSKIAHEGLEMLSELDLRLIKEVAIDLVLSMAPKMGEITTKEQLRDFLIGIKLSGGLLVDSPVKE